MQDTGIWLTRGGAEEPVKPFQAGPAAGGRHGPGAVQAMRGNFIASTGIFKISPRPFFFPLFATNYKISVLSHFSCFIFFQITEKQQYFTCEGINTPELVIRMDFIGQIFLIPSKQTSKQPLVPKNKIKEEQYSPHHPC